MELYENHTICNITFYRTSCDPFSANQHFQIIYKDDKYKYIYTRIYEMIIKSFINLLIYTHNHLCVFRRNDKPRKIEFT